MENMEEEEIPILSEESIFLNPSPKIGSEIKLIRSQIQQRRESKRFSRSSMLSGSKEDSIIRDLLNHPSQSELSTSSREKLSSIRSLQVDQESSESLTACERANTASYRAKVKALTEWNSVTHMDQFLQLVHEYYLHRGHTALILKDASNLTKLGFTFAFVTFLVYFIDWSFLSKPASSSAHPKLWEIANLANFFRQISIFGFVCIGVFGGFWFIQFLRFWNRLPLYDQVSRFYNHLLEIQDKEIGDSVDFGDVCEAISLLHAQHKVVGDQLDARDICNRIMRRDNYLIAIFNRDLLDLDSGLPPILGTNSMLLTRILEWNISFCLMGYVFEGEQSSIRAAFLKTTQRDRLSDELRKRFQVLAVLNFIMAPFIFVFIIIYLLFRYGEELYRNPSSIKSRQYSPWAHWTLREFNELEHLFDKRLMMSYEKATKYIDSFAGPRYVAAVKVVSFVAGSFVLVLLALSVYNEDLLMHFEITSGKSIIWYLGLFGAVLTISRALIPDPRSLCYDKIKLLEEVSAYLHYAPDSWKENPESLNVRKQLSGYFPTRLDIFYREMLGLLLNPFILYNSLPRNAEKLVEFFREFSMEVEGLGYVCSFAMFDLERHGNADIIQDAKDERRASVPENTFLQSQHGKLEKSLLNFKVNNPHWQPDPAASQLINRLSYFADAPQSTAEESPLFEIQEEITSSAVIDEDSLEIQRLEDEDMLYTVEDEEERREKKLANVISVFDRFRNE